MSCWWWGCFACSFLVSVVLTSSVSLSFSFSLFLSQNNSYELATKDEVRKLLKKSTDEIACYSSGKKFSAAVWRYYCTHSGHFYCESETVRDQVIVEAGSSRTKPARCAFFFFFLFVFHLLSSFSSFSSSSSHHLLSLSRCCIYHTTYPGVTHDTHTEKKKNRYYKGSLKIIKNMEATLQNSCKGTLTREHLKPLSIAVKNGKTNGW